MHNPFPLLQQRDLHALIASGNTWFVRQTYPRGMDPLDGKQAGAFLISYFNDSGKANAHYQSLGRDIHRHIYDIAHKAEREKLETAATQPQGYKIYLSILAGEKDWYPPKPLAGKIRVYLEKVLLWRPGTSDQMGVKLQVEFGELFLKLRLRNQEAKVPLVEIEQS